MAIGAVAIGAVAIGAVAIGAVAIGAVVPAGRVVGGVVVRATASPSPPEEHPGSEIAAAAPAMQRGRQIARTAAIVPGGGPQRVRRCAIAASAAFVPCWMHAGMPIPR